MGMQGGASGTGSLKVVNGRLYGSVYVRLICRTREKDGKKLCGSDFIFQQDWGSMSQSK